MVVVGEDGVQREKERGWLIERETGVLRGMRGKEKGERLEKVGVGVGRGVD